MPYVLVHPLPPPRHNPYYPSLPTFTTSSRPMAHFFHSHGWRAKHIYVPFTPRFCTCSSTLSRESSPPSSSPRRSSPRVQSSGHIDASSLSLPQPPAPDDNRACCPGRPSSIQSCGPVLELHCYNIPVSSALFYGPFATKKQVSYLLYYAWGHIDFESEDGTVGLRTVNEGAVVRQRERDGRFWREHREEKGRTRSLGEGVRTRRKLVQSKKAQRDRTDLEGLNAELDEEIDEEMGMQWEQAERALLASGDLEWYEVGKTLRKTRDI